MKYAIVFLMMFAGSLMAQTANYSISSTNSTIAVMEATDKSILYSLYDTLSGSNDTLIVTFDSPKPQYCQASLGATWLATGTTSSSFVVLQGRNTSYETWNTISTATYSAEITTSYDSDPVPYLYIRLMMVSAANIAHLRTSLCLKEL